MKYMGSKNKIAKYILPIMLVERKPDQWWVEPFVGGANMIDKVEGNRLGNDINEYLIALLVSVRDGWLPPTDISKEMYQNIKYNKSCYPPDLVGFVGFLCSFGGKWFDGYAKDTQGRNYAEQGRRALVKQSKNLSGIVFKAGSYLDLDIPEKSLIYCDPPYASTIKYRDSFDHDIFWEWCMAQSKNGHTVFISEYTAPDDFICIKEIEHVSIMNKSKAKPTLEKLFIYKG